MKYLQTAQHIAHALVLMLVRKIGWLPDEYESVIHQREEACSDCQLRDGNWCSKHKSVTVSTGRKEMTPFGFEDWIYERIKGCGCWLTLKRLSNDKCPLNKWEEFPDAED